MKGKIIIDKWMDSERKIPFTHISSNFDTATLTLQGKSPEIAKDIDIKGLRNLKFSTLSAEDEEGGMIYLAADYNHVASVSISFSDLYTLQIAFDYIN